MKNKFVTVFGSSVPKPGDEEYETAYLLGKLLAEAGLNVCTGGYQGIMDAVSKGARLAGAEAIGVTIDIYNSVPSKYLSKEIKCKSLFERLENLMKIGDAYIVLQGGTGTLVELAIVWEFINKKMMPKKPIACHGKMWSDIVKLMDTQIEKEKREIGLIKCFSDIKICANYIIDSLS
ncbi:LOG family protein [Melioribacter sp. OK-6-Me]|uniref:LOG family protein n=1 Tax=unclassified Melioribacter TaxID=2627329 RepID=UPI003EDB01A4